MDILIRRGLQCSPRKTTLDEINAYTAVLYVYDDVALAYIRIMCNEDVIGRGMFHLDKHLRFIMLIAWEKCYESTDEDETLDVKILVMSITRRVPCKLSFHGDLRVIQCKHLPTILQ